MKIMEVFSTLLESLAARSRSFLPCGGLVGALPARYELEMSNTVVVKVGTGVLTRVEDGRLDGGSLLRLVSALAELKATGRQVVLVSSGAVGCGVSALGLKKYPETVPERQAAAAVGQARLMHIYENLFSQFELSVAQILLTGSNLKDVGTRQRLHQMVSCLFDRKDVVPIVNQNDSLDIEELSQGDNRRASP